MIGRGKSSGAERELQDVLRRLERAEADNATATAALAVTEAAVESRLTELALSDCSPDAFHAGKVEAVTELQRGQADVERCASILRALSGKADELAVTVQAEKADAAAAEVAALTEARDEAAATLRDVSAKLATVEGEAERARLGIARAARYTEATRAAAEQLARQEAEQIEWLARHPGTAPPAHLVEAVAAERARLRAEVDAANARLRQESAQNLRAAGLDPADAAAMVGGIGDGRRWKRLRVN